MLPLTIGPRTLSTFELGGATLLTMRTGTSPRSRSASWMGASQAAPSLQPSSLVLQLICRPGLCGTLTSQEPLYLQANTP